MPALARLAGSQKLIPWGFGTPAACAPMIAWYAIFCRCQFERSVEQGLAQAEIESFYPFVLTDVKWSKGRGRARQTRQIERSLFPGYVFARFDAGDDPTSATVHQVRGVVAILGTPYEGPIPIPDEQIEAVRALLESGLPIEVMEHRPHFETGERVEIKYGPFAGQVGRIERRKNKVRMVIAIPALNRDILAEVDAEALKTVPEPSKLKKVA